MGNITLEKTFGITKTQIHEIYEDGCSYIKSWFPEAFEEDKVDLKVGEWYKNKQQALFYTTDLNDSGFPLGYGFSHNGTWVDQDYNKGESWSIEGLKQATQLEIEEAFTKEAVKRYKKGDMIKCPVYEHNNYIGIVNGDIYWADGSKVPAVSCVKTNRPNENFSLFYEGKWATVIQTITKEEAELKLGVKII